MTRRVPNRRHTRPLLGSRWCLPETAPLLLLAVSGVVLLACGPRQTETTLRVANWAGPEGIRIEERILDGFRREHPGVRVDLEPIPRDYVQKMLTGFAGGRTADVFLVDAIHLGAFVRAGALVDLRPWCGKYGLDLAAYPDKVLALNEIDGGLYALPKDFTPLLVIYNKDLFDLAEVSHPAPGWTWSDFLQLCARLTAEARPGSSPATYGTLTYADFWAWPPWVWSAGGDFLAPDGRSSSGYLNGPETVSALEFLLDLRREHGCAAGLDVIHSMGGDVASFAAGRVAMAVAGHWWLSQILVPVREGELRVGTAPIPVAANGRRTTVLYAAGWAVSSQSAHRDLAFQLAAHLGSLSANRMRMGERIALPAQRELLDELVAEDPTGLEEAFAAEAEFARVPWGTRVAPMENVRRRVEQAFANALLRGTPIERELSRAAADIDALLEEME